MARYWKLQNVEAPPSALFPFDESDIDEAFQRSNGIPREVIKQLIPKLDALLSNKPIEEVTQQDDYVIKLTANVLTDSIVQALTIAGVPHGIGVHLHMTADDGQRQKASIVELSKGVSIRRIGIDVPSVKDWDRSGGVTAFYAGKRLKTILDDSTIERAIIAVPAATKGAKFNSLVEEISSKLLVLRMDNETATSLVQDISKSKLPHGYAEAFAGFVDSLFLE